MQDVCSSSSFNTQEPCGIAAPNLKLVKLEQGVSRQSDGSLFLLLSGLLYRSGKSCRRAGTMGKGHEEGRPTRLIQVDGRCHSRQRQPVSCAAAVYPALYGTFAACSAERAGPPVAYKPQLAKPLLGPRAGPEPAYRLDAGFASPIHHRAVHRGSAVRESRLPHRVTEA